MNLLKILTATVAAVTLLNEPVAHCMIQRQTNIRTRLIDEGRIEALESAIKGSKHSLIAQNPFLLESDIQPIPRRSRTLWTVDLWQRDKNKGPSIFLKTVRVECSTQWYTAARYQHIAQTQCEKPRAAARL